MTKAIFFDVDGTLAHHFGTWLRDYIYYPVSLSKPMKKLTSKARKRFGNRYGPLLASSAALLCVWLGNGLWHGAGSQYIFFGMYYFVLIVAGSSSIRRRPVWPSGCTSVASLWAIARSRLRVRS